MLVVKRSMENPVLLPNRENAWEAEAVFNGCPIEDGDILHLLYRAESAAALHEGTTRSVSSIGCAESPDGIHFSNRRQFLKPEEEWEKFGCEDPRVTKFEGYYYVFYTALSTYPFAPEGIKIAVAVAKDFKTEPEKHPVTTFNAKAMALFPERVGKKIAVVLTANTDRPPARIGVALLDKVEDLWSPDYWNRWYASLEEHTLRLHRGPADHIEVGAPPLKTKDGWLVIYSYIQNYFSSPRVFGVEAVLLNLKDPMRIIGKTEKPLFVPEEEYEKYGRVPNIVFPTGALLKGKILQLYYGAADTTCCLAMCGLNNLLDELCCRMPSVSLSRHEENPIIRPIAEHAWESRSTFNPAAVRIGEKTHILYRAMSQDNTSVFGYAASADGTTIDERLPEPVYVPRKDFEMKLEPDGSSGCEDPRLTLIGETLYMCYTAFDGKNPPRVALSSISLKNFLAKKWNWAEPALISPPGLDDKDAAIFPKKIRGKYAILHRLGGSNIWLDYADSLAFDGSTWIQGKVLMTPRTGRWDSKKIGIAAPPIETPQGWLLLYHGISKGENRYRVKVALLDLENPERILARLHEPLLDADMPYEREGEVPNVVFPCGAVVADDTLFVYYGGADKVIGVATTKLSVLLERLAAEKK